jgi:hypothetical protein
MNVERQQSEQSVSWKITPDSLLERVVTCFVLLFLLFLGLGAAAVLGTALAILSALSWVDETVREFLRRRTSKSGVSHD